MFDSSVTKLLVCCEGRRKVMTIRAILPAIDLVPTISKKKCAGSITHSEGRIIEFYLNK